MSLSLTLVPTEAKQMTKLIYTTLALLFLGLSACKEEISVTSEYKEAPVIYSLLDQNENVHMVKINRGFIGPGNAFDFAKIPDSNYFENVSAKVEELVNNVAIRTWNLQDTMIATKSTEGIFFGPEQKVYFFETSDSDPLIENAIYRLTVDINEGKLQVVGETKLVAGFATSSSLHSQTSQLKLAGDPGEYKGATVYATKGSAVFGSTTIEIDIAEIRGSDTTFLRIPWKMGENAISGTQLSLTGQGEAFYNVVKAGLTNDNSITRRNFMGFNAKFIGGANEFYNYILVNKPSSSLTQTKPIYTNLTVTNGFNVVGLFSARSTVEVYKPFVLNNIAYIRALDQNSTRELCEGSILSPYLFCSQHPGDIGSANPKTYACP